MSPHYDEIPLTDKDMQRLALLSDVCFERLGIRLLSTSGPPGIFTFDEDGNEVQLANFAPLLTEGFHTRSLDKFEDSVDILCIPSSQGKDGILLHDVGLQELTAKAIKYRLGIKSGLWIAAKAVGGVDILEKLIFIQVDQVQFHNRYSFNGRDPDNPLRYICFDGTELTLLERFSPTELQNAPGDLWTLLLNVNKVMPNSIGFIVLVLRALASMLSSPALEGRAKPSLGLVLLGPTGVQKTSVIEALYGMYGMGNRSAGRSNFKSTASSIQALFAKVRDDVVVIDDIFPPQLSTEKRQEREIFSFVVRAVGDEGGARQKCQGKDVTSNSVSSLFVFTAEIMPACSLSDVYRTVVIQLPWVDTEALSWLQAHQDTIRYYSRLFVQYVSLNNAKVDKLYQSFLNVRKNLQLEDIPKRLISNGAWLEAGCELLGRFCQEILEFQSPEVYDEFCAFSEEYSDNLENVIWQEALDYGEQGTLSRIFSILREMYEEDPSILGEYKKYGHKYRSSTPLTHAIGFYEQSDRSFVYLRSNECLKAIKKYCVQQGYPFDDVIALTPRKFRELLAEAGLIAKEVHTASERTKRLQVEGTSVYVTYLDRSAFEQQIVKIR